MSVGRRDLGSWDQAEETRGRRCGGRRRFDWFFSFSEGIDSIGDGVDPRSGILGDRSFFPQRVRACVRWVVVWLRMGHSALSSLGAPSKKEKWSALYTKIMT